MRYFEKRIDIVEIYLPEPKDVNVTGMECGEGDVGLAGAEKE